MMTSISNYPSAASTASSTTPAKAATPANDPLANKQVFLNLLVAQLKHQDPLQPQDGVQFVTQLAQFSQLEQSTQATADLDAIKASLAATTKTGGN